MEVYICPHCGGQGKIMGIMPIIGNVRYDAVACECGAEWRVYYEFTDPVKEVMYIPEQGEASAKEQGE